MSRFTEATWEANGETVRGRPSVALTSPLAYDVGFLGSGWRIEAETGFVTDLASIPPVPEWLKRLLAGGRWRRCLLRRLLRWRRRLAKEIARSAIVHDKMRVDMRWPKLLGDYVFFEAMGVDGVSLRKRVACFVVVLFNFSRY